VVESEIISTTIVRKNNLRVPCQKSSMGKLATTRYKPQNKDASICPQQGDPPRKPRWKGKCTNCYAAEHRKIKLEWSFYFMQKQLIPRVLEGLAQVMLSNARTVQ
jgi:hypothetical protein